MKPEQSGVPSNGEIYNHRESRCDLERKGHHFRGHSDSEVTPCYGRDSLKLYQAEKHCDLLKAMRCIPRTVARF
ncbi:hypothetical protein [Nitrospira sp. BLG_1]|uniref:hypothetical protein n=1 Tax=Nitrospira sp. BLG_1 TaxID=3395883 RepID=UPI0039BC4E79